MPTFLSDGIEIAYDSHGEGKPIVLVHGFASNRKVNWVETGWVETLTGAGYRVVTIDNRGHGESEKLYDPEVYSSRLMARDVAHLIDHLDLGAPVVMGYSMGARISAFLTRDFPDHVSALILGGLAMNLVRGMKDSENIVAGLLAPSLEDVTDDVGRQFRRFADHTGADRVALAACMQSSRDKFSAGDARAIKVPVLVAVGSEDEIAGDADELAALLPHGQALIIPRRDHMRATGDKIFKQGVLDFLKGLTSWNRVPSP